MEFKGDLFAHVVAVAVAGLVVVVVVAAVVALVL